MRWIFLGALLVPAFAPLADAQTAGGVVLNAAPRIDNALGVVGQTATVEFTAFDANAEADLLTVGVRIRALDEERVHRHSVSAADLARARAPPCDATSEGSFAVWTGGDAGDGRLHVKFCWVGQQGTTAIITPFDADEAEEAEGAPVVAVFAPVEPQRATGLFGWIVGSLAWLWPFGSTVR